MITLCIVLNDVASCVTDFIVDEIGGSIFSFATRPFFAGMSRAFGRDVSDWLSDTADSETGSGGVGDALTVIVGETTPVYAPAECPYSTCEPKILWYFANRP